MIPKIIHQTWKNKTIPEKWKHFHQTWKEKFPEPEYKHVLWSDKDNRELIEKYYNWFLKTYDSYPKNIQRADAVRYFILHRYGGIYADLDCEVRSNFYYKLDQEKPNLVEDCFKEDGLMNNLMASPKKLDIWENIFDLLEKKKNVRGTLESTGPTLLTKGFYDKNLINILDYQNFNPLKKRSNLRYIIENTFFTKLDYEKSKTWDSAEVVHHSSESWYTEEVLDYIKYYAIFILFILIIIFYIKRRRKI